MEYCKLKTAKEIVVNQFKAVLAAKAFKGKMAFPKIEWKSLGVRRAGYATFAINTITLNKDYLHSPSWKEFLNETPLHELAHLLAYKIYKSHSHDRAWKNICFMLGLVGNRCHTFETPEDIKVVTHHQQRHTVYCNCRKIEISTCRFKRMLAGEKYRCRICGAELRFNP